MKSKLKLIVPTSLLFLFASTQTVFAALVTCGRTGQAACTFGDLVHGVYLVVNYLVGSATVLAMAYLVYGGFSMMLSRGNQVGVGKAKETMTQAIFGLLIVLLSYLIVTSVTSYFTGKSFSELIKFF